MQAQKLYEEYTRKVREDGREEGLRDAIAEVCTARGLKLSAVHRAKLATESAPGVLRRWLARAAEIFANAR